MHCLLAQEREAVVSRPCIRAPKCSFNFLSISPPRKVCYFPSVYVVASPLLFPRRPLCLCLAPCRGHKGAASPAAAKPFRLTSLSSAALLGGREGGWKESRARLIFLVHTYNTSSVISPAAFSLRCIMICATKLSCASFYV